MDSALKVVASALSAIPGIEKAWIMTPARSWPSGSDKLPSLVVEIDFQDPSAFADSVAKSASRDDLLTCFAAVSNFAENTIIYQPMLRRHTFGPDPQLWQRGGAICTYLVEYPGEAEDLEAWLDYFARMHAPILARLPNVRAVTLFEPAVVPSKLAPWCLGRAMQRNKIVFDDVDALDVALTSPVIAEIKADAAKFPSYSPGPTRTPMFTRLLQRTRKARQGDHRAN